MGSLSPVAVVGKRNAFFLTLSRAELAELDEAEVVGVMANAMGVGGIETLCGVMLSETYDICCCNGRTARTGDG